MLLTCIAAAFFGKDINFDAINYHAYAPFGLLEGRINTDFFPAGPQSYLNPVGYIPFYFLRSWFSDFWVVMCLAALHSGSIYALIYLARELICRFDDPYTYYVTVILAVATTVFWQVVGSSFIDGYVCMFVLLGLVYLLRCIKSVERSREYRNFICAALFFGVASGLKLTAIIYALSAACVLFVYVLLMRRGWYGFLWFAIVGVLGFFLIEGWWAYLVFKRTGNPFFPYFNNIFSSPFYPAQSIGNARFIPHSFTDAFLFPLRAVLPLPWLYQELRAPDIRLLIFFVSLPIALIICWKKLKEHIPALMAIAFFVLSYVLWLFSTGNGRYGIPLFLLIGVLVAWSFSVIFRKDLVKNLLLGVLLLQLLCVYVGGSFRWSEENFSGDWFGYELPEKLIDRPTLYLTLDSNSYSFLAQKVHPRSSFSNLSGQLLLPNSISLKNHLSTTINDVSGNVRFIAMARLDPDLTKDELILPKYQGFRLMPRFIYVMNARFSRFGFKVDETDCVYIEPELGFESLSTPLLVSCALKVDPSVYAAFAKEVRPYDLTFDAIESKCPDFFDPKISFTEKFGDLWMRRYLGSEVKMYVSAGSVWLDFTNRILPVNLGKFEVLVHSVDSVNCENTAVQVSHDVW
jgi:hypothetical protein